MRITLLLSSALLLALFAGPSGAAKRPVPNTTSELGALVRAARHDGLRVSAFGDVRAEVEKAYEEAGWQPLWLEGQRPSAAAKGLVARLAGADSLGLDPADYDAEWLETTLAGLGMRRAEPTADDLARFDVGLSVASARLLTALDVGRVKPKEAHPEGVHLPAPTPGRRVTIADLRRERGQGEALRAAQPPYHHYQLLKNALAHYRKIAADPRMPFSLELPRDTKPGMRLEKASTLRRYLEGTGDLGKHKRPKAKADTSYSPELVEAVKKYQARHGQLPDGVLWIQTLREMEMPFAERVRQIELSLERWRWMPKSFAVPPVIVNVPAFRLYAFTRETDRDVLSMDVLVGAADKNETPIFTSDMKYLIFRPWWELPASIMNFELGPRAQWDWENLQKLGYVLQSTNGRGEIPLTPENLDRKGYRMRQKPGDKNALGLVKFMFPNPYDIYLHDTPAKGLFALPRRDMSHGCIRVSDPPALAAHLLRGQGEWSLDRVKQAMETGEDDVRVDLETPVPVYILYATSAASDAGTTYFYPDIYGLDSELDAALRKASPAGREEKVSAK
jgi:murein L,D-transpeptidase YcbB/YkuD